MAEATPADLTVVIPTRDRWDILRRTLDGLAAQTATGFETVVVVDGPSGDPPDLGVRTIVQEHAGPGAARNRGVAATDRPLVLFLGDDMVPAPDLVARHLAVHRARPADEVAVLGRVVWHPEVAGDPLLEWLEWSGAQFDYRSLRGDDAGWARFYSCNVSLKRSLFLAAGGFDEVFVFYYEDLDCGWRLGQHGMQLRYEPGAVTQHLHRYDWASLERRFAGIAVGERMMAAKHDWFEPFFARKMRWAQRHRHVSPVWARVVDRVPERPAGVRRAIERRANRWYNQRLAPAFLEAWDAAAP